jgi:NTP pyrophosphatase (non-canonical NTP hydrolase)
MNNIDEYGQFTVDLWQTHGELDFRDTRHANPNYDPDKSDAAERSLAIMSLGLAGETGEVIEKIKKILRDGTYDEDNIVKELGDVVYYWARLCRFFGKQPSEIIETNVHKLTSRKERGVLRGSGDNR